MQTCIKHQNSNSGINNTALKIDFITEAETEKELKFFQTVKRGKEKIIKQLPNIYKNTRVLRFLIQHQPMPHSIEYKKIKGLILNIQKRFMWYAKFEEMKQAKVLLLSIKSKSVTYDLNRNDEFKDFFNYYTKIIFEHNNKKYFISIPLVDLNIDVI